MILVRAHQGFSILTPRSFTTTNSVSNEIGDVFSESRRHRFTYEIDAWKHLTRTPHRTWCRNSDFTRQCRSLVTPTFHALSTKSPRTCLSLFCRGGIHQDCTDLCLVHRHGQKFSALQLYIRPCCTARVLNGTSSRICFTVSNLFSSS